MHVIATVEWSKGHLGLYVKMAAVASSKDAKLYKNSLCLEEIFFWYGKLISNEITKIKV